MKQPGPNQHYRISSVQKAVQDHKDGIITATGLVYYTVGIYRAPGQKLRVKDIDAFCQELEINRATFYRAISKLKAKNRLEWEAIAGVDLWIPLEPGVVQHPKAQTQAEQRLSQSCETLSQGCETLSQDGETLSQGCETLSQGCETLSQDGDKQGLEAAPDGALGDSSDIYQSFINSLSEGERENFWEFGRKKASQLPKPPELPLKWIEANWGELRSQWQETDSGRAAKSGKTDWTSHPDWSDWLLQMRSGVPRFVALGTCFDNKTRRAIADWADERGLIWGSES